MVDVRVFSVSELTHYVKDLLEADITLSGLLVSGEISNFTHHSSGHMYFTLKDSDSRLKCVMFRSRASLLSFTPREGMKVLLQGRLSVYERHGEYQLYVENMQPDGIGALYLAFLELKQRLEQEGLFASHRKKQLPLLPKKIGVVTSPSGAAIRDIVTTIQKRFVGVHIVVVPVLVQGESAARSIAEAIHLLNEQGDVDVIIVGRGGGSIEELWAFNEEIVARAIAASEIPVVSAVGHETDYTIADLVADVRVPTPTAAGQYVVPSCEELLEKIAAMEDKLASIINRELASARDSLHQCLTRLERVNPVRIVEQKAQEVDSYESLLNHHMAAVFQRALMSYQATYDKLEALSPLRVLRRGFAVISSWPDRSLITSVKGTAQGQKIAITFTDGEVKAQIQEKLSGE